MSMEWQVTDLETSKKLRELGVRQDKSNFYWNNNQWGVYLSCCDVKLDDKIAAFTLAELFEISRIEYTNLSNVEWVKCDRIKFLSETILNKIKLEILNVNQINERLGEL